MPNIPYRTDFSDPEAARVADAFKARRGGRVLNLDRMLLHRPEIAEGWNVLMSRVRQGYGLPARSRELAICAVASLNGADYEFRHHLGPLAAAGMDEAQIAALDDIDAALAAPDLFPPQDRAVLNLARDSTRDVTISASTLAQVKAWFPQPETIFELLMVIASYNMVSRVLVGLGVEIEGRETPV